MRSIARTSVLFPPVSSGVMLIEPLSVTPRTSTPRLRAKTTLEPGSKSVSQASRGALANRRLGNPALRETVESATLHLGLQTATLRSCDKPPTLEHLSGGIATQPEMERGMHGTGRAWALRIAPSSMAQR